MGINKSGKYRLLTFTILLSACIQYHLTAEQPARGKQGMVSSAHPIATQAGLSILKSGGNAFDAAVAVAATLNVVEPMMSGIGGYGTILIFNSNEKRVRFLDSSGKIPLRLNPDVFRPPTANYRQNRKGVFSISTPGNVNAWEALYKRYGSLKWSELFQTAIKTAEAGFILNQRTARLIQSAYPSFSTSTRSFYGHGGRPLNSGEHLIQKDLARTLNTIAAQGARAVYRGRLAERIVAEISKMGGALSLEDLNKNRAEWWQPIQIKYRDCVVYTSSPPSTAFPSLIRLGLMSRFKLNDGDHNTIETLHRFIESTKIAYACRLRYAGDPDVQPPPLKMLLSESYWQAQVEKIDPDQARHFAYPDKKESGVSHTTHFVVADKWGNIVSATQTLGNSFGCRIMPEGTGIWLNNSLAYCTFEPKGNPMDAHPGRRKLSGDCPTIIFKDGKPWVALGTPGGHTIGQTVPQMVMNLIDFKMNIADAIASPRVSFLEPDTISIEPGIAGSVIAKLKARGHNISILDNLALGNAHALTIRYNSRGNILQFSGAADPRGSGSAIGY